MISTMGGSTSSTKVLLGPALSDHSIVAFLVKMNVRAGWSADLSPSAFHKLPIGEPSRISPDISS